jgi:hypothetical protein
MNKYLAEMNERGFKDRSMTAVEIQSAQERGQEILANAQAAKRANAALVSAQHAAKEKARRDCAPIVAAQVKAMVKPEFQNLVAPVTK